MKNKYSGLSDAEIDYLVAEKRNLIAIDLIYRNVFIPKTCSSHSDAFKLMIDNEIDLLRGRLHSSRDKWVAVKSEGLYADRTQKSINENPCRAIAECFLLMKDAENEQWQI